MPIIEIIKTKSEGQQIINFLENQAELTVREFHTDNRSEFIISAITNLCNRKRIKYSISCTYTSQNNDVIEQMRRSLLNVTGCLIT